MLAAVLCQIPARGRIAGSEGEAGEHEGGERATWGMCLVGEMCLVGVWGDRRGLAIGAETRRQWWRRSGELGGGGWVGEHRGA